MKRIRILTVGLARVLGDMIAVDADMEVMEALPDRGDMLRVAGRTNADVVILALDDGELPEECIGLFEAHPRIKVVGVAGRGRQVYLYDLRPSRRVLGEVSPSELADAIRRAIASGAPGRRSL